MTHTQIAAATWYRLTVYKDRQQAWRWRLTASNGRKVANAGEGYRRKIDCVRMAQKLFSHSVQPIVSE